MDLTRSNTKSEVPFMKIPLEVQADKAEPSSENIPETESIKKKSSLFSSRAARLFFLLLLLGDIVWFAYALALFVFSCAGKLLTLSKTPLFNELLANAVLTLKRSLVC